MADLERTALQLESEMEKLRGQGGDLSGHQRKLEEHQRHLADLENQPARTALAYETGTALACTAQSVLNAAVLPMLPARKAPVLSGAVHVCRAAKEKDHLAGQHEREAGKLGDLHARKQQGLSPLEAEMENLRRCCLRLDHH